MRLPTHQRPRLRQLALTAALLGTGLAQAAGLTISSGSVAGGMAFQAEAQGQPAGSSASLTDLSGQNFLLGTGSLEQRHGFGSGGQATTLDQLWVASASLDASDAASLQFQLGSTSVLALQGSGPFGGGSDRSSLAVDAELLVASTGETAGTAVRLVFSGSAEALASSSGPAVDALPSFDLVVRDAQSNILASWQGGGAGSNDSFHFSLDTRVGDSLWLSLSHDSSNLLGSADSLSLGGDTLDATTLFSGTVQVTAVPEPGAAALLLAGLAGLGWLQRRTARRGDQKPH